MGVLLKWSDVVKKRIRAPSLLLALALLVGLAMVAVPPLMELMEYRTDEHEYTAIAEQFRPPGTSIPAPMPDVQEPCTAEPVESVAPTPWVTEAVLTAPENDMGTSQTTAQPTGESDDFLKSVETPSPEAGIASQPKQTQAVITLPPEIPPTSSQGALATASPAPSAAPTAMPTGKPPAAQSTPSASQIDLSACTAQNKDFVAWLTIPGTVVDYPVVRSDNTAYYLHHLFSGKESKLGCLFSLTSSDYATPSRNIAIYGHHLSNSNAMFSTLMEYKRSSYYPDHSLIRLDSIYGTRTYRIFAVVNMKVSDWDAATARFSSDEDLLYFVNRAKNKALYDTGIVVKSTDNILTLITCDRGYGGASGRLIVMAVQEQ